MDPSPQETQRPLTEATAALAEADEEFAVRSRMDTFRAEMGRAPMPQLIHWRGRIPDDLAPTLERLIEDRRPQP